jgi:hypothetical protein
MFLHRNGWNINAFFAILHVLFVFKSLFGSFKMKLLMCFFFKVVQFIQSSRRFEASIPNGWSTRQRNHVHFHRSRYQRRGIFGIHKQCALKWSGKDLY